MDYSHCAVSNLCVKTGIKTTEPDGSLTNQFASTIDGDGRNELMENNSFSQHNSNGRLFHSTHFLHQFIYNLFGVVVFLPKRGTFVFYLNQKWGGGVN